MWWKRRKVEYLFDELTAIALLNRFENSRTEPTAEELRACAVRDSRQLELLAEIARLNSEHGIMKKLAKFPGKKARHRTRQKVEVIPTPSSHPRAA